MQRRNFAVITDNAVSKNTRGSSSLNLSIGHITTGNIACFGDMENFANFGSAKDLFFKSRRHHAKDGILDFLDNIINNLMMTYIDIFLICICLNLWAWTYVKADNYRFRYRGQGNIRFGYGPGSRMGDIYFNFIIGKFCERIGKRLDRALHICLYYKIQLLNFVFLHTLIKFFKA